METLDTISLQHYSYIKAIYWLINIVLIALPHNGGSVDDKPLRMKCITRESVIIGSEEAAAKGTN